MPVSVEDQEAQACDLPKATAGTIEDSSLVPATSPEGRVLVHPALAQA